tara:strand:- start:272 stop:586 length:315 start_codon:yes stop_codon:yes gene_type:complete
MKRIIDGLRYDTDSATEIADMPCNFHTSDFAYHSTKLYITKNGSWFLAGEGGPSSLWKCRAYDNNSVGGEGIRPLSKHEAMGYLESWGEIEELEKFFSGEITNA